MIPAIAAGSHGNPGGCGGPPVFGRRTTEAGVAVALGVGLGDTPGLGLGVGPGDTAGVGVGAAATVHVPTGGVMLLVSNVSVPVRARARPVRMLAPVTRVISVCAIRLP